MAKHANSLSELYLGIHQRVKNTGQQMEHSLKFDYSHIFQDSVIVMYGSYSVKEI